MSQTPSKTPVDSTTAADIAALVEGVHNLSVVEQIDNQNNSNVVQGEVYNLPFDRTFPALEPMVHTPNFIEEEHNSPLALLNNNYWQDQLALDNYESIKIRANTWFESCGVDQEGLTVIEQTYKKEVKELIDSANPSFERIFIRDAERCYNAPSRRSALCHILTYLQKHSLQGDYHQGLALLCSFLMCFLPAGKVIAMAIHANERLLPQVFKSQSTATVVDGYVLLHILSQSSHQHHRDLAQHFQQVYVIPEMFAAKYWCALAVHLLPFQAIVYLNDRFWGGQGVLALYEVVLVVMLGQIERILKQNNSGKVLELIGLDHKTLKPEFVNELTYLYNSNELPQYVQEATELLEQLQNVETLQQFRDDAYQKHIQPRIARYEEDFQKQLKGKEPDCARPECQKPTNQGVYFCMECNIHLCEDCAYSSWGEHNDEDHWVRTNEDVEYDEQENQ